MKLINHKINNYQFFTLSHLNPSIGTQTSIRMLVFNI